MDNKRRRTVSTSTFGGANLEKTIRSRLKSESVSKKENKENVRSRNSTSTCANSHALKHCVRRNALSTVNNNQITNRNTNNSSGGKTTGNINIAINAHVKNITFRDENSKYFERVSPDYGLLKIKSFSNENLFHEHLKKSEENYTTQRLLSDISSNCSSVNVSNNTENLLFRDGKEHQLNSRAGCSELLILSDGIPSVKRRTFKKDLYQPTRIDGIIDLDPSKTQAPPGILYSLEYLDDIMDHFLLTETPKAEDKNVKKISFIPEIRMMVINWLLKLQQYFESDTSVYFIAVQLFDKILQKTVVPPNQMQVIGLVCYWIAMKHLDTKCAPKVQTLENLCSGKYSRDHILKTEIRVLNFINFDIPTIDPMFYIRYYIYRMKLVQSEIVSFCANYILDCMTLDHTTWGSMRLSRLAAAAITFVCKHLDEHSCRKWKILFNSIPGFYTIDSLKPLHSHINNMLTKLNNEKFKYREPFHKYSYKKFGCVSELLKNI